MSGRARPTRGTSRVAPTRAATAPRVRRVPWTVVAASLVAVGAILRVATAFGDLWMDEVWSLKLVHDLGSPLEIVTRLHHDNNHALNSLWLYALGDARAPVVYRLVSVASGTAAVALTWAAARRYGAPAAALATGVSAVSYPLVLYSSEARGYAAAVACALGAFVVLDGWLRHGGAARLVAFWVIAGLGFLAHLSFLHVYVALALWSVARAVTAGGGRARALARAAVGHAVPLGTLAALWAVDVRYLRTGGGPVYELWTVVADVFAFALGVPDVEPLRVLAVVAGVAIAGVGIARLRRTCSDDWPFYVAVFALAPAAILLARRPEKLYFRYFLVCVPFFYVVVATVLAELWTAVRWGPIAVCVALALFVVGQGVRITRLVVLGRGQYCAAVRFLGERTAGDLVTVGSDHDFRNRMLLDFYGPRCLPPGRRLEYRALAAAPEWMVTHDQTLDVVPPAELVTRSTGARWDLVRSFRYGGVSGWHWFVYRRRAVR